MAKTVVPAADGRSLPSPPPGAQHGLRLHALPPPRPPGSATVAWATSHPGQGPTSRVNVQRGRGRDRAKPACLSAPAGSPDCSPEMSSHAAVTIHRCQGSLSPDRPNECKTQRTDTDGGLGRKRHQTPETKGAGPHRPRVPVCRFLGSRSSPAQTDPAADSTWAHGRPSSAQHSHKPANLHVANTY